MAFAWMVARAAWKPSRVRYKGHDIKLDRGQLTISIRDLADAMDRPKGWVERLLVRLREHGMIEQKNGTQVGTKVGTHGGTVGGTPAAVITVCNYEEYQGDTQHAGTLGETLNGTRAGHAQDTEQRREEGKKEEERESDDSLVAKLEPKHVVEAWNEMAERLGLSKVRKIGDARMKMLKVRIRQHTIEDFTEAISAIERSSFLRGEGRDGWRADFDFFLQPKSFIKLIEGSYDRSTH